MRYYRHLGLFVLIATIGFAASGCDPDESQRDEPAQQRSEARDGRTDEATVHSSAQDTQGTTSRDAEREQALSAEETERAAQDLEETSHDFEEVIGRVHELVGSAMTIQEKLLQAKLEQVGATDDEVAAYEALNTSLNPSDPVAPPLQPDPPGDSDSD